tara:strand:- start:7031 stop:7894 length:864 start_codon:yes stop_codon:yes gene_type:complete
MTEYNAIDLLDEDKPIAQQKFVCLSFVSPEKILKQKDIFLFEQFIKQYNFDKNTELLTKIANFLSYKYEIPPENILNDVKEFITIEREDVAKSIEDEFKTFIDKNEDACNAEFMKEHNFQTSVRGIKVRGVFPTQEEAELRCKLLRQLDPNHDVYVGPVGLWVPFHPDAYKTGKVEYLEKELNQLMHEKKDNEDRARSHFEDRVKSTKLNAIEENIKTASDTGNKLTQTINERGELIGLENTTSTVEKKLGINATLEDIKKELFEGDDTVTTLTDHGLSNLENKQIE